MSKRTAHVREWYDGYRLTVSEAHYQLLLMGANRGLVNPFEMALTRLGKRNVGMSEDCGDKAFRRSHVLEQDAPRVIWKRR